MSDIRKFMTIVESQMHSGIIKAEIRDEDVFIAYEANSDGIDWYIDGKPIQYTRDLDLDPREKEYIDDLIMDDINHSF